MTREAVEPARDESVPAKPVQCPLKDGRIPEGILARPAPRNDLHIRSGAVGLGQVNPPCCNAAGTLISRRRPPA
jgi:hypothetical protein